MQPLEEPVVGNFSPHFFGFAIIEPAIGNIFFGQFLDQTCQLDISRWESRGVEFSEDNHTVVEACSVEIDHL